MTASGEDLGPAGRAGPAGPPGTPLRTALWVLIGVAVVATMADLLPFEWLPVPLAVAAWLLWTGRHRRYSGPLLALSAYPLALVAYANSDGPRNPYLFGAAAVGLLVAGLAVTVLARRPAAPARPGA